MATTPFAGWEKAEKAITKGKGDSALKILRGQTTMGKSPRRSCWPITPPGWRPKQATTEAITVEQPAPARVTKKNPRDKKADRALQRTPQRDARQGHQRNHLPRLLNDGTPTPAGIVAIFMAGVLVLAMINVANRGDTN